MCFEFGSVEVYTEKWRERLVNTNRRNVIHTVGRRVACCGICYETEPVHVLLKSAERVVRANGKDALIGMVDVYALENIAEPRQRR